MCPSFSKCERFKLPVTVAGSPTNSRLTNANHFRDNIIPLSPAKNHYIIESRLFFNIFEKTQAQKKSTAQKTQQFFRPKLNEPVAIVVT